MQNGYHDVPAGRIATVVTHLQMTAPVAPRPVALPEGLTLAAVPDPDPDWYRDLFFRVGTRDWLWFSRVAMPRAALAAEIAAPGVEVRALWREGVAVGLCELDFRAPGVASLAFFGVTADLAGTRAARFMMNAALARAWAMPIGVLRVSTCTLDHPRALDFYRRSGFVPVRQQVQIADDPRLTGAVPQDVGPHVPVFPPDP